MVLTTTCGSTHSERRRVLSREMGREVMLARKSQVVWMVLLRCVDVTVHVYLVG